MSSQQLKLEATRCPVAMIYVRQAVREALDAGFKGVVVIHTIEASMERDLPLFLSNFYSPTEVDLIDKKEVPLLESIKSEWLNSGEAVIEDLANIDTQHLFTLTFK